MGDPNPPTVTMQSPEGELKDIPADQAAVWQRRGFTPVSDEARTSLLDKQTRESNISTIDAFGQGAGRTLTGGGTDAFQAAIGGDSARQYLRDAANAHPIATTAGEVAGVVIPALTSGGESLAAGVPGMATRLGGGIAERVGGGFLGAALRGSAEGAVYGAGNAVSELALSDDPLTAEHVASSLSSNVLFGAGVGGVAGVGAKLFERGLQLAGEKLAAARGARASIEGLPEELRGLDEAGLKDAYKKAEIAHAKDIEAEVSSLEGIRANQRAEMAHQAIDLHENLATERPIFSALSRNEELNPALEGIDGINHARVQMADSFGSIRKMSRNPINLERDPFSLVKPLEMRQAALETLQEKMPEMHAALAGDAQALSTLEHVDGALAETKQQIAAIRSLSRDNPLTSGRLTALKAGPSDLMQQIKDAQAALKQAPQLGMVGKAVSGAAFAGGTALAHMIPGVGLAAPFVGKAVSEAVEKLFQRGAGVVGKVGEKASAAAEKFLGATKALEPYVAPAATKTLSAVRFGTSKAEQASDLAGLYKQRTGELFQQTMRQPDGTTVMRPDARAAMAQKLDPIRQVNPILADKIETVQARKVAYLAQVAPKKPDAPALQIGPDNSRPSDMAMRAWARTVRAVEDPASVEERLARGIVTPEEADAYRNVYPERFAALQKEIWAAAPQLEKTLPMNKKVALSIFTGVPVTPAMQPNVIAVLQSTFDVEPGSQGGTQAPRPQPNFGALGSLKDIDKPTPSQAREQGDYR